MVITPNSVIKLYRDVDICNDENLLFSSREKLKEYFMKRLVKTVYECTMVKHQNGVIRIDIPGALASKCNYMSFTNPDFENKEIFCRIAMIPEYTNNECTQLAYTVDYWLTYYDEVHFEDMYIDREHLSEYKYNKSLNDPYDISLWEFRTNEPLPISNDTETVFYNTDELISLYKKSATDGGMASAMFNAYYDFIYISDIDFTALDMNLTGSERPSEIFKTFGNGTLDFRLDYGNQTPLQVGEYFSSLVGNFSQIQVINTYKAPYTLIGLCNKNYLRDFGYFEKNQNANLNYIIDYLTKWGVLSSVIGIYRVPAYFVRTMFATSQSATVYPVFDFPQVTIDQLPWNFTDYKNKKLANYPYSYIRLMSPLNEDIKELRREKFREYAKLYLTLDFSERPTLMVMPGDYEYYSPEQGSFVATSRNAMLYNKFPTTPYTVDSWLAQMSANAQGIIANNTTEYMYEMGQERLAIASREVQNKYGSINTGGQIVGSVLNLASGNIPGGVAGLASAAASGEQLGVNAMSIELAKQSLQNRANMSDEAYNALAGVQEGNAVYTNFAETRPAYAANKYVAPSGDGILNYHPATNFDIVVMYVNLNEYVMEKYDKWFDNFGYSSGRCGIPYCINYALGETDTNKIPHFAEMSDGKYTTYIKTNNCRVSHTQAVVSNAISQLFDNGVRFVKGDDL